MCLFDRRKAKNRGWCGLLDRSNPCFSGNFLYWGLFCPEKHEKTSLVVVDKRGFFRGAGYRSRTFSGSNPPTANFFRLLCSVHLPQKVREIFGPKTQKTGPGTVSMDIPKPVFAYFTVFRAISGPKKENCLICPVDKSGNYFVYALHKRCSQIKPNRSPAQRVQIGKEEQRHERAPTCNIETQ